MKKFKQIAALLQMSLSGIPQRLGSSLVTIVGIACVVGVLVAMLSMGAGVRKAALQNARNDRAVVLAKGAQSSFASNLDRTASPIIMDMPGIKKDGNGRPMATAMTIVMAEARKKIDNARTNFPLFAVDQNYFSVYPELRITAGRMFQPAVHELIAGNSRHELFKGLEIGDVIHLRGVDWTIVGHFAAGGGSTEDRLIGDADTVISAYGRNSTQAVTAVLDSPAAFNTFETALKANPSIDVDLKHEAEVLEQSYKPVIGILNFISYFVGTVMAIGATLGAINVMYTIVDGRKREMATLRAIGFSSGPIIVSVLIESIALALPGALLGVLLAWSLFNGNAVNPVGISFKLTVTAGLAVSGITWAVLMGVIGGVMPAIRAARVPVATALRAT